MKKELQTKTGALRKKYEMTIITLLKLKSGKNKLHLKYWVHSCGRYRPSSLCDTDYYRMLDVLDAYKIKYETGNDAPKEVYFVDDVDYCIEYAKDWQYCRGDFAEDTDEENNRAVFVND